MALLASALRRRAASCSVCESRALGSCWTSPASVLDAGDELGHALHDGGRVHVGAGEGFRRGRQQPAERGLPAFGQRPHARHGYRGTRGSRCSAAPAHARRGQPGARRVRGPPVPRARRPVASRSASLPASAISWRLMVALEEPVGSAAETVPDRFGLVAPDRADRLPLGLQPLHLGGGRVPVGRLGQRLGALAERFLARQVLGPHLLPIGQILAAAREERVARRHGSAGRARARRRARSGRGCCHSTCSCWNRGAVLRPVGRRRQRLGLGDDRGPLLRWRRPRSSRRLAKNDFAPAADEIGRGPEPIPEPLRATGAAPRPPPATWRAVPAARGRSRPDRTPCRPPPRLERGDDGLGHRDELFLPLGVGEAPPVVHLAQLADPRRDLSPAAAQHAHRLVQRRATARPGRRPRDRRRCRASAARLRAA